ncbi:MAG: hypothetical protein ABI970_03690 [Chloroflexota bacterium]
MMWRLWKALKHPTDNHPVFMRVLDDIYDDATRLSRLMQNVLLQGQIWLWPLLFIIDMRLVCLMIFSGTISGAVLSLRISDRVANEQQRRTYDLLCLTPGGTMRTLWAICIGCLHREQAFEILNSQEAWIVRFGLFIPFIVSSQLFIQRLLGLHSGVTIFWATAFFALFYIDHIQATVFSCICGMLAAQQTSSMDKRLWAVTTFAAFQVCSYLFTIAIGLIILPDFCRWLMVFGINNEISQMIFTVGIFYLTREGIITFGWRRLMDMTNTRPADIDFLTSGIPYPSRFKLDDDTQTVARA